MAEYLGDDGIYQPGYNAFETGQNLRALAKQAVAAYREGKKTPHEPATRQHGLSQAMIDGREPGWEEKSDTINARVARMTARAQAERRGE